jgi:hypothetical protein
MYSRIALGLSALFWLTMNFLLWRSEFGGGAALGTAVPPEVVWRKILTAPDNSMLDIFHHGRKQGFCRWSTGAGLALPPDLGGETPPVEQPISPPGYRLNLTGNLALDQLTNRLQFDLDLILTTNRDWQEMDLRLNLHGNSVAVHSVAADRSVRLRTMSDGVRDEQTLSFADLQNPQALARAFDLPLPLGAFGLPGLATNAARDRLPGPGLTWTARNDRLPVGHTSLRVYRLESTLLDRYRVIVLLSRVGEILRVELPDNWEFINEEAGGLQPL